MQEDLKGKIVFAKVDAELLDILNIILGHIGEENSVKIGDIVAMDEHGCRLSSMDEVNSIPKEKIIYYCKNRSDFEGIVIKK